MDAAGRFCIRGVQPGSWDLLVHGGGHARLLRVALPIKGAGTLDDLKLRLPPALSLRGRVVDAQGHAAAGVTVEYMRSHPVSANLTESVRTADDGRFEIPGFTREDEGVSVYVGGQEHKVTPRDGPIEIRLSE